MGSNALEPQARVGAPLFNTKRLGFFGWRYKHPMPTVLRIGGWRFVVYPNDHPPAHVHIIGPGWIVVVNLHGPVVREVLGPCSEREARQALELAERNDAALLEG